MDTDIGRGRREHAYDWLRMLSTVSVVLLHTFSTYLDNYSVNEVGIPVAVIWTGIQTVLTRWAVPMFLMISGALLLKPSKEMTWERVGKYVNRPILALCSFGFAFCILEELYIAHSLSLRLILLSIRNLLTGRSWAHMWYTYTLIGLYLLTPVFQSYLLVSDKKAQRTLLLLLFVFALCMPTIGNALNMNLYNFIWLPSSVFYYLFGWYVSSYIEFSPRLMFLGLLSVIAAVAISSTFIYGVGSYAHWITDPSSPLIAMYSMSLFTAGRYFLNELDISKHRLACYVTRHSFGIYLVHPIILNIFYKVLSWTPYRVLPPCIFEVVVFGITFVGSALLVKALSLISLLREIV